MNRSVLNQKAWYRALKVMFVLVFLIAQIIGFVITNELASKKVSFVHCDNGKEFIPATLSFDEDRMKLDLFKQCDIVAYFFNNSEVKGVLPDDKRKEIDNLILQMQSQGSLESEIKTAVDDFKTKYSTPNPDAGKKYTAEEFTKIAGHDVSDSFKVRDGNYWIANFKQGEKDKNSLGIKLLYYILSFFIVNLIFWLISRTFFYIFAKEKFLKLPIE